MTPDVWPLPSRARAQSGRKVAFPPIPRDPLESFQRIRGLWERPLQLRPQRLGTGILDYPAPRIGDDGDCPCMSESEGPPIFRTPWQLLCTLTGLYALARTSWRE